MVLKVMLARPWQRQARQEMPLEERIGGMPNPEDAEAPARQPTIGLHAGPRPGLLKRASPLLANLGLSAGSLLVVLLVLEGALRAAGYRAEVFSSPDRVANGHRSLLLDCYPSNPRGYFDIDLRDPATRERYRRLGLARVDLMVPRTPFAVERRYNSLRFRGPEIPPRRAGVTRVVVIGDSFTEGMGVREEDAYPRVLARLLIQDRIEVLNCGRRGYDFPALFDLFEDALHLDPDIVIYGMVLNDPHRSPALDAFDKSLDDWIMNRDRMAPGAAPPAPALLEPRLVSFVRDRLHTWRLGRETTRWYHDLYGEANLDGWRQTQEFLREMNRQVAARGGRFMIAIWPLFVDLEGKYPFEDIEGLITQFSLQAGLRTEVLRPTFKGRATESLWVHPVDHHPNQLAHLLVAERLAPVVRGLVSRSP